MLYKIALIQMIQISMCIFNGYFACFTKITVILNVKHAQYFILQLLRKEYIKTIFTGWILVCVQTLLLAVCILLLCALSSYVAQNSYFSEKRLFKGSHSC